MMRLPVLPIVAAAALVALTTTAPAPEPVDTEALESYLLAEQIDDAAQGAPCIPPNELNGREPLGVVVSPANAPGTVWGSNIAYRVDVDTAWTEAKAGEIVVRCVIIAVPTQPNERNER